MGKGIHYQQARDNTIQIGQARNVDIGTRRPHPGVPFQAPAVPHYFVPRLEVSQTLQDYLAADTPTSALVVSAAHGLGGIGKTTLVAALAHDPDVQARFPDGVLWATLGQQPDVLPLLAGWIQALSDYDFRPTVVESASAHLHTLLHDKACLLVVDDAWQADHTRPFLVGGARCRLVITTRNAALASEVDARLYDLDVMTEAQALALFQARLGPLNGDREQAAALARKLGYLPLTLELAAAQVETGRSWAELLDAFQSLTDLAALGLDEAAYCNEGLHLSFLMSLEQLSPDDQDAFGWLGMLPEDVRLSPAMAATLWDQPEADAHRRLRRLRDRALLKSVGDDRYTLHDLLHDEAKLRLVERMPLPEAHAALLARYRQKAPDRQWHRLPDDGYVYEHLTWHTEQARQTEAIHALLREETAEGKNGWYQAHDWLGQTAGYLADVTRAWRLAGEEFAIRHSPLAIGLQCRYALIIASLNSLAKSVPPALLTALVKQGVWTPAQGLAYARRAPEPRQQAEALAGLASRLAALGYPEEAQAVAQAIEEEDDRVRALVRLALRLAELGHSQEALAVARAIEEKDYRARALVRLAPYLPEAGRAQALREALVAARAMKNECWRAKALARLVPHLPEAERTQALQEALAAARAIGDKNDRATVLVRLAPHLSEAERTKALREALAAAWEIRWAGDRAEALARLAPHLPEAFLGEAQAVAQAIESEWWRAAALAGLAPHLPEALLREAQAAARGMENECWRAEALAGLVPYLPEDERTQALREALAAARAIRDKESRATVLAGLAPYLPKAERAKALQEALAAARAIRWASDQAAALAGLASHLPEAEHAQALQEALAAARAIRWAGDRARALAGLVLHLPEAERAQTLREALAAAREIRDKDDRARTLVGLAPHLPEPEQERALWEALAAVREIGDADDRVEVLVGLAPRLAELGHPEEALAAARAIESEYWRAKALAELAPHLPEAERAQVLQEALATAREIEDEDNRVKAPAWLAPPLAELGHPEEALAAAREIGDTDDRAKILAGLASHLAKLSRQHLYPLWQETLHFLATRTRKDLLSDLGALSPVIAALGGAEAVAETARAIQDVGRWWP